MKTVTLKTDDTFFEKLSHLAAELHLSKSELIRRSVAEYERHIHRRRLKERFKAASTQVRSANENIIDDFDDTIIDGLEND